jgi:hypothetical protein
MPGEDLLRGIYPNVLSVTYQDAERFAGRDPEQYLHWLSICHDLYRQRRRSVHDLQLHLVFEGWPYTGNPFEHMNFDQPMPPSFTSVMQTQNEMTIKGNAWLGIGVWGLAEEYYKVAIRLAIVSNDTVAALQNGANLALCYLAGGDCQNALRLCEQLINASIGHEDSFTAASVLGQAATIVRWCYFKTRQVHFALQHTAWLLAVAPQHADLDSSIFGIISGVWNAIGDQRAAENWTREWTELQEVKAPSGVSTRDRTSERRSGGGTRTRLTLVAPAGEKPNSSDYVQLMDEPTEQFELLDRRAYMVIGRYVFEYGKHAAEEFVKRLGRKHPFSKDQIDKAKNVILGGFATGIRLFVAVATLNGLDLPFQADLDFAPLLVTLENDTERSTEIYNRYKVQDAIHSLGDYAFVFRFYSPEMDGLPFRYPNSVRLEILSSISLAYSLCLLGVDWLSNSAA